MKAGLARQRSFALGSTIALTLASCGDPAEPKPVDTGSTGPVVPVVVNVGETRTLVLPTAATTPTSLRVRLKLTAGDTVDVGLFSRSSAVGWLALETDPGATAGEPTATWISHRLQEGPTHPPVGSSIYAGLVVAVTGEYPVRVLGYPPVACPPSCRATGNIDLAVRRSAPAIVLSHRPTASVGRIAPSPTFLHNVTATIDEGSTATLDTIWIRNAGAGSVTVNVSPTSGVTSLPQALTLTGPTPASASAVIPIKAKSPAVSGFYFDTVALQGIPDDVWHEDAVRRIVVELRVNESAGTRADVAGSIMHLVATSDGKLVATGSGSTVLSSVDPQSGARNDWRSGLPTAPCCNANGLVASPAGGVYVAQSTQSIARVTADSLYTVLATGASRNLTVGSDGTLYYLTVGAGALARRRTSGQVDTLHLYGASAPNSDVQYGGILFNPVDSAIYYRIGDQLARFSLKTLSAVTVGPLEGGAPQVVDANGYMYGIGNKAWPIIVSHRSYVTVLDRDGKVVDRRWPASSIDALALHGSSLYGIARGSTTVIWSLPIRSY